MSEPTTVLYRFSESEGPVLVNSDGKVSDEEKSEIESLLYMKDTETIDRTESEGREALYHLKTNSTPWMKGGADEYYLLAVLFEDDEVNSKVAGELSLKDLDEDFFSTATDNWKGFYTDEEEVVEQNDGDMDEVRERRKHIDEAFGEFTKDLRSRWKDKRRVVEEEMRTIEEKGEVSSTRSKKLNRKELGLFSLIFASIFGTPLLGFWGLVEKLWDAHLVSNTYNLFGIKVASFEFQLVSMFLLAGLTAVLSSRVDREGTVTRLGIFSHLLMLLASIAVLVYPQALWVYGPLVGLSVSIILVPLGVEFARRTAPEDRGIAMLVMGGLTFSFMIVVEYLSFMMPDVALGILTASYLVSLAAFVYFRMNMDSFSHDTTTITVHEVSTGHLEFILAGYLVIMMASVFVPWSLASKEIALGYRLAELVGLVIVTYPFLRRKHFTARKSYLTGAIFIGLSVLFFGIGVESSVVMKALGLAVNGLAWGAMLGIIPYIMWINSYEPEESGRWIGIGHAIFYVGLAFGVITGRYFSQFIPETTVAFIASFLIYVGMLPVFQSKDTSMMRIRDQE